MKVTLINTNAGVEGHKAGCADVGRRHAHDDKYTVEVISRYEAYRDYNTDFLDADGNGDGWPIDWKPCAHELPEV
jgi:hypothetical protein